MVGEADGDGVTVGSADSDGAVTWNGVVALRLTPITFPRIVCDPTAASDGIVIRLVPRPFDAMVTVANTV